MKLFRVSEFAIKCLEVESDETIEMFFFQLVQALKHQNYYSNPLLKFLLKRALNNRRLGQKVFFYKLEKFIMINVSQLFWTLKCEITSDQFSWKIVCLLETYLLVRLNQLFPCL